MLFQYLEIKSENDGAKPDWLRSKELFKCLDDSLYFFSPSRNLNTSVNPGFIVHGLSPDCVHALSQNKESLWKQGTLFYK